MGVFNLFASTPLTICVRSFFRASINQGVAARDAEQKAKALEEAKAAEAAARAAQV